MYEAKYVLGNLISLYNPVSKCRVYTVHAILSRDIQQNVVVQHDPGNATLY